MRKRFLHLNFVVLTLFSMNALSQDQVNCIAIAKAGFDSFSANYNMNGTAYTEKSMLKSLEAYCKIGVGGFILGKSLDQTINETANIIKGTPEANAALLSATVQGYLYSSAKSPRG